jgi:hypothetical protein
LAGIAFGISGAYFRGARLAGANRASATTAFAKQMRVFITAGRGHHDRRRQPRLQDEAKMSRRCPQKTLSG